MIEVAPVEPSADKRSLLRHIRLRSLGSEPAIHSIPIVFERAAAIATKPSFRREEWIGRFVFKNPPLTGLCAGHEADWQLAAPYPPDLANIELQHFQFEGEDEDTKIAE